MRVQIKGNAVEIAIDHNSIAGTEEEVKAYLDTLQTIQGKYCPVADKHGSVYMIALPHLKKVIGVVDYMIEKYSDDCPMPEIMKELEFGLENNEKLAGKFDEKYEIINIRGLIYLKIKEALTVDQIIALAAENEVSLTLYAVGSGDDEIVMEVPYVSFSDELKKILEEARA